jgi:hypothetical protein
MIRAQINSYKEKTMCTQKEDNHLLGKQRALRKIKTNKNEMVKSLRN